MFDSNGSTAIIMVNPSTADADVDDATPIGPENDDHLMKILAECDHVICAWGPISKQPKRQQNRYQNVLTLIKNAGLDPFCIGEPAKCGHPKHPLMLPYSSEILPWAAP